jgi:GNAT superfamily N-acetyltransferase
MDNAGMGFVRSSVDTADAADLAALQQRIWRTKYHSVPALVAVLEDGNRESAWRDVLESPAHRVLVATDDERALVGYLIFATNDDEAEIEAIDIDPQVLRAGHGSRLMQAFVDLAQPIPTATMWCDASDGALRTFLMSSGWGPDGSHRVIATDDGTELRQIRMVSDIRRKNLSGESPAPAG